MSNITQFGSGGAGGDGSTGDFSRIEFLNSLYENRIIISSSTTFVVPIGTKAIKFTAVGGGQAGTAGTGGPGGGYFEKSYVAPFTGLTTSFQLTIGAAGGNTILADSAGTTIATAFGATAISGSNPVGIGGTASGGDVNYNGSPGGTTPGVGGASGGKFGHGIYDSIYYGRWVYFKESLINDHLKNLMLTNFGLNGGVTTNGTAFQPAASGQAGGFGIPGAPGGYGGGIGGNGGAGAGPGGFGGNGGPGNPGAPAGIGGPGGFGGFGGPGGDNTTNSGNAIYTGPGGPGGFGGGGGIGGLGGFPQGWSIGGIGGKGGFGGGGGASGQRRNDGARLNSGGPGGEGAIIVEWTTTALPT